MEPEKSLANVLLNGKESIECRGVPACSMTTYINKQGFGKTFVPNFITDITPDNIDAKGKARIMIVGEAPDAKEDELNRPFSGPVHYIIENSMRQASMSRDDVYFTNVLKCRPVGVDPETGNLVNREPDPEEVTACKPLLEKEISAINPDVIIAMGGTAIKALTGEELVKKAVNANVMFYKDKEGNNTIVVPTYHPSATAQLIHANYIEDMMRVQQQRNEAFKRAATLAAIEGESANR